MNYLWRSRLSRMDKATAEYKCLRMILEVYAATFIKDENKLLRYHLNSKKWNFDTIHNKLTKEILHTDKAAFYMISKSKCEVIYPWKKGTLKISCEKELNRWKVSSYEFKTAE